MSKIAGSSVDQLVHESYSTKNAEELFSFVSVLNAEYVLRRALTDHAFDSDQLAQFIDKLLDGKLEKATIELISQITSLGWPSGQELSRALERAGAGILFRQAERGGKLDEVRDELFKFGRLVSGDRHLREIISNPNVDRSAREALVTELLAERALPETVILARRAVHLNTRSYEHGIRRFLDIASDMRSHACAKVQVARQLTPEQHAKMVAQLQRIYGVEVDLEIEVVPNVVGGVRIEIADDVIDGSISSRIAEAQRSIG